MEQGMSCGEGAMWLRQCSLSVATFTICSCRIRDILPIQQRNTGIYQSYKRETYPRSGIADETIYNKPVLDRTEKSRKIKEGHSPNRESQTRINGYIYGNINNIAKDLQIGAGDAATWWRPYIVPAMTRSDNEGYNRILGIIMSIQIIYWNIAYNKDNAKLVLQDSCRADMIML